MISKQQKRKVEKILNEKYGDKVLVDVAMRYGTPSIANALDNFQEQGVNNIIVLPLYPQYAGPTTGATFDAVFNKIKTWRWIPSIHFQSGYHDHPLYIQALVESINNI